MPRKGQFKETDYTEIRECVDCKERKLITEFVLGTGNLYRYMCKACKNAKRRTGKISETRFQPGHDKGVRYEKGHIPWHNGTKGQGLTISEEQKQKDHRFNSWQYNTWRDAVFKRDGNKCVECGSTNMLAAHHIKPWKDHFEIRFDTDNGKSLCNSCHGKIEGFQKGAVPWNKKPVHSDKN